MKSVQFRHARNVPFRLLMIIGIIALAGGLSSAEAKHDGWGHRASIRAGTSTVGEIRVGTWAGISTLGSITAGIEVLPWPAEADNCVPKTAAVGNLDFLRPNSSNIRSESDRLVRG